jgi:GAF domain-containing protein
MASDDVLPRLAALAGDLGPALLPPGHDAFLRSLVGSAVSLFGAAAASIAVLHDGETDHATLEFVAAAGRGAEAVLDLEMPATEGLAGFVVRSGQPIVVQDVRTDPRFDAGSAGATGYVPTVIAAAPLETDRGVLGVLEVLDPGEGAAVGTHGMDLLGELAQLAAAGIEGARIFSDLGTMLFSAASSMAGEDAELASALRDAAAAEGTDPELAELAETFAELRRLGPDERRAASSILRAFLRYASEVQWA